MWGVSQAALRRFYPLRPSLWRLPLPPCQPDAGPTTEQSGGFMCRTARLSPQIILLQSALLVHLREEQSLNWEFIIQDLPVTPSRLVNRGMTLLITDTSQSSRGKGTNN